MLLVLTILEPRNLPEEIERKKNLHGGKLAIGRCCEEASIGEYWAMPETNRRVSRNHCYVERIGDKFYLSGSNKKNNGVYLNHRRLIEDSMEELSDGDRFSLCTAPAEYTFMVTIFPSEIKDNEQVVPKLDEIREQSKISESLQIGPRMDTIKADIPDYLKDLIGNDSPSQPSIADIEQKRSATLRQQQDAYTTDLTSISTPKNDNRLEELLYKLSECIVMLLDDRNRMKEKFDIPRKTIGSENKLKDLIGYGELIEPHRRQNVVDSVVKFLKENEQEKVNDVLEEVFDTLRFHPVAILEAIRVLPKAILDKLKPSRLQELAGKNGGLIGLKLNSGAAAWSVFIEVYAKLDKEWRESHFQEIIAKAYEDAEENRDR